MSELTARPKVPFASSGEDHSQARVREQFERLARRLARPLKAIAIRYAHPDLDLAEDLVQHALTAGYRLLLEGRFHPELGAYTWFSAAIRNEFLAHQRRQVRLVAAPDGNLAYSIAACPGKSPFDHVAGRLLSEPLCEALDTLPIDQRVCVELVDLAGLDYRAAAKAAGIPVGTLRSRLARARLRLAARLTEPEHRLT